MPTSTMHYISVFKIKLLIERVSRKLEKKIDYIFKPPARISMVSEA